MALYGIHWQMTETLRNDLPDGGVALVTDQLLSSAQGVGAIVEEGAVPDIQWHEMDSDTAKLLNTTLIVRGWDPSICCFEAGDWFIRATIETKNGPG